jgi:hypothetical protein
MCSFRDHICVRFRCVERSRVLIMFLLCQHFGSSTFQKSGIRLHAFPTQQKAIAKDTQPRRGPFQTRGPKISMYYIFTWNLGFVRILSPYSKKSHGNGHMASAKNPNKLFPQPRLRAWYMERPNRGTRAPIRDRTAVNAPEAEASYKG